MRLIYTIIFYLLLPFAFLRLWWRGFKSPEHRKNWGQRLGYAPFQLKESLWIHAVSLGETIAAIPLIKALLEKYPTLPIVVTNMTATGAAKVKAAFEDRVHQTYIPYDIPHFLNRLIHAIHPKILVIMETELWPNLFAACKAHAIPIIVTNARLSEKSARGYSYIPHLNREMFSAIHRLAAQSEKDAERFQALGLPREKIVVTGNLKFDLELPDDLNIKKEKWREKLGHDRFIWIAASTHAGEDEIILEAHRKFLSHCPEALLILVPRHPERFQDVSDLIKKYDFSFGKRSALDAFDENSQVFLVNSVGELLTFYAISDVALLAGSFVNVGGHNMLEPAALHKPILSGPHLFNFADVSRLLLEKNGLSIVKNADEITTHLIKLCDDDFLRNQLGENAYSVVAENRGALQRQVDLIAHPLSHLWERGKG